MNFKECQCSEPGLCPLFDRMMDKTGIDWCKTTSEEKRKKYFTVNNPHAPIEDRIQNHEQNDTVHQSKIIVEKKEETRVIPDMSNVCIASLGHCPSQFETIKDRKYISKIYLQDLNLGKFSKFQDNQYSETRAYLGDIFDYDSFDYLGVTTASWNLKYHNRNKIDRLEKWIDFPFLYKNNAVMCATTASTLSWIEGDDAVMRWLSTPQKHIDEVLRFHQNLGMEPNGKQVANHNQIICHKDLFIRLENYHQENIFEYSKIFDTFNLSDFSEFARKRLFGFYCEFSTMMFLANNEVDCRPMQRCNNRFWFDKTRIQKRDEGIYNDN